MNTKRLRLSAAPRTRWLASASLALVICAAVHAQTPRIFTCTKAALPGDVVIVHGADFVQGTTLPEVWLDRITGSADTPDPETPAPEILSYSDKLLHVRIPASLGTGLYALFVKCGSAISSPAWINRADAWQTLDLGGSEIDPGRAFRLYGWNLDLPGATPQVWFKNTATGVRTAATVTNADRANFITLSAPASLAAGQGYQLIVSNGYGGSYGETDGPVLACVATPADALNLGVPWADEFAFAASNIYNVKTDSRLTLHAVGDGVADDSAALQAACDAATGDGGGQVYLPAGTYSLGTTILKPRQRVVIRGAGMNLTTVVGQIEPWYVHSTLGTTFYNGALDLTLTGGRMRWNSGSPAGGPVIVVRVRIDHDAGTGLDVGGGKTQTLVKDCEIITRSTTGKGVFESVGTQNLLFKNNYVQWSEGRIEAGRGLNTQIDGCEFARTVATANNGLGYGGWEVSRCNNIAIIDNVFEKIGSGPIPQFNDGETILNQGVPRFGAGHPTAATATTLTDTARAWTPNQLTDAGAWVVIVSGPGEGQWRRIASHTADTVTLDTPWDITPTTASGYTVTWRDEHWLIAGNILQDCPRATWFYSCTITDAAIVRNSYINSADLYLRADQRLGDPAGGRFTVFRNILIQDNEILNTNHAYPSQLSAQAVASTGEASLGNAFWDVTVRGNSMDSIRPSLTTGNTYGVNGEGYFAIASGPGPTDGAQAVKGVLFDRNTARDLDYAFRTGTGAFQTTVWKPSADNVGALFYDTIMNGGAQASILPVAIPRSRLYLNTWSPRGNISTDLDPIAPAGFFDWLNFGATGTVAADAFGSGDTNTGSALAAGGLVRFTIPAGSNYSVGNAGSADNFKDVLPVINALPAGTYTVRLSFDYASNYTDARSVEFMLYSDNAGKDSGGNDRWETGSQPVVSTNDQNAFAHYTKDYTFTLVNPSAPVPRPEGSFETGRFKGFRIVFTGDARQAGDPTLILRMDNLALDLL